MYAGLGFVLYAGAHATCFSHVAALGRSRFAMFFRSHFFPASRGGAGTRAFGARTALRRAPRALGGGAS
eukprot:3296099-Alexandrium_andersonii.AAC.1